MSPRVPKPRRKSAKQRMREALLRQRQSLRRGGRITTRKVSKRFAQRRDAEYAEWIRSLPCALTGKLNSKLEPHQCEGPIEATHVRSRGAGGDDYGNLLPLDHRAHQDQHRAGFVTWANWFYGGGINEVYRIARDVYPAQYEKAKTLGWGVSSPEDK